LYTHTNKEILKPIYNKYYGYEEHKDDSECIKIITTMAEESARQHAKEQLMRLWS